MRRIAPLALALAVPFAFAIGATPQLALADVMSQLAAAESSLGVDNSDKTAVERVGMLETELGIAEADGTLAERLKRIESELGIDHDAEDAASPAGSAGEDGVTTGPSGGAGSAAETGPFDEGQLVAPSDDFVLERVGLIPTVDDIAAVTEDHDPNGKLGKQGGYIGCIYFSDARIDGASVSGSSGDVIEVGTVGGGCVEVFANEGDALAREAYLAAFDGTAFSSGSHKVVGTCLIRTSDELTASQQKELTQQVIDVLSATDVSAYESAAQADPSSADPAPASAEPGDAAAQSAPAETATVAVERATPGEEIVLYDQDGYTLTMLNYMGDGTDKQLTLHLQNLTHHDVVAMSDGVVINGQMTSLGIYFDVASGKSQTQEFRIWRNLLESAGVTSVDTLSFELTVSDKGSFSQLAVFGPYSFSVDADGWIAPRAVYTDPATVAEAQSLLNAAGYDCGPADGVQGKNTNAQILQFERDRGLREDTDITDELLGALRGL